MRFVLTIDLGNDAMQTAGDIAHVLRKVATDLARYPDSEPEIGDSGSARDVNGNRVANWHVESEK